MGGSDGSGLLGGGGEFAGVELGLEVIALDGPGGDEGGGFGAGGLGGGEVFLLLPVFEVLEGFVVAGGDVVVAGFGLVDGGAPFGLFWRCLAIADGDDEVSGKDGDGDLEAVGGDALGCGAHVFFREDDGVSGFDGFDEG